MDSVDIIICSGKLDVNNAPQARQQWNQWIEQGHKNLLFDFERVDLLDSSGLAALVNTLQKVRSLGGDIALLKPRPEVGSMLRSTRLHSVLGIFEDEESAIQIFDGRRYE